MRKFLLIAAIFAAASAAAQKNSILLQGGLNLTSSKVERADFETKTFRYTAMPRWGYQFSDHWTAGVQWSVSRENIEYIQKSTDEFSVDTETKNTNFSVGGFVRYTLPINEWFAAYADLDAGYQGQKSRTEQDHLLFSTSEEVKGSGFVVSLTPQVCINIGARGYKLNFSVGSLGYSQIDYEDNLGSDQNFGLNFGKSFTIGLSRNFQL